MSTWTLTSTPIDDKDAADVLRRYFTEIVGRYHGRPARDDEVDAAMAGDAIGDLALFLLARYDGEPAGCVEIPAYSDDPCAEHWFEKRLAVHSA
jgi:hypothetical protein